MAGLVLRPAANVCGNPSFSAAHRGETFARGMRAGDGDGIARADTQVKGIPAWNFAFPAREKQFPVWDFAFPHGKSDFLIGKSDFLVAAHDCQATGSS